MLQIGEIIDLSGFDTEFPINDTFLGPMVPKDKNPTNADIAVCGGINFGYGGRIGTDEV